MTDYKSMFEQAVRTLAAIDDALGIGDDGCGDPDQTLTAIADLKASPISEEAMDILRAENEKLKTEVEEFAVLTSRLARQLKKAAPDNELPGKVADYLKRTGRHGSPLREVGSGETAVVTREMIGAAHDVMLAKCDFVLSAGLLERIYLAMDAKRYNVQLVGRRPSEEAARAAIEAWLDEHAPGYPEYSLCEDGDEDSAENKCGWAFWICPYDTTSYLHEDLSVEWYGTGWDEDPEYRTYKYDGDTGNWHEVTPND